VSSFTNLSGDAVHQPTWPLLLKIKHMVKLQILGNKSKTVNNIKNLTRGKNDQHSKIYLPCNFEVNLITHLGVIALFSSTIQTFNTFRPLFQKL
jgi:E3 ubiquitin-protein ligase DOA10